MQLQGDQQDWLGRKRMITRPFYPGGRKGIIFFPSFQHNHKNMNSPKTTESITEMGIHRINFGISSRFSSKRVKENTLLIGYMSQEELLSVECVLSSAVKTMCVRVGIDSQRRKECVLPFFGLSCHCNFVLDFVTNVLLPS